MRRGYHVKIELEFHAITCPGVWLCPKSGNVDVAVRCLGYHFNSGSKNPKFPILLHKTFTIEGLYQNIDCFKRLERIIFNENIEISLWQSGRRLANYSGKLENVLNPKFPAKNNCNHDVNVHLLMVPSTIFSGIIGPKAELSAGVIVVDMRDHRKCWPGQKDSKPPVNVQRLAKPNRSKYHHHDNVKEFKRQKPVCHSWQGYRPEKNLQSSRISNSFGESETSFVVDGNKIPIISFSQEEESPSWCLTNITNNGYQKKTLRAISPTKLKELDKQVTIVRKEFYPEFLTEDTHQQDCKLCWQYNQVFHLFDNNN